MRVIAFVTQKGGSGKSTLASSLAVAAMEAGERVFIIDMDPQRSLVKWSKLRGEADVPVQDVSDAKIGAALSDLGKKGVTLCIIDTAGLGERRDGGGDEGRGSLRHPVSPERLRPLGE